MNVSKFNHEYFTNILTKIKNENKNIILMGDCNVNLINCYKNRGTYEFLEQFFNHNSTNYASYYVYCQNSSTKRQNFCKWPSTKV